MTLDLADANAGAIDDDAALPGQSAGTWDTPQPPATATDAVASATTLPAAAPAASITRPVTRTSVPWQASGVFIAA